MEEKANSLLFHRNFAADWCICAQIFRQKMDTD